MGKERDGAAGDEKRRMTRRAAIATGGAAYAASVLAASPAFAQTLSPAQLIAALRRKIRRSQVDDQLKSRVLKVIAGVENELAVGHNTQARTVVEKKLIPLLLNSRGHHGLNAKLARHWIADSRKLLSTIPRHDKLTFERGAVRVFNCHSEPIVGLWVEDGVVGNYRGWSEGGDGQPPRYTPGTGPLVLRTLGPSDGCFAVGPNLVWIPWTSFTGVMNVYIPRLDQLSIEEDLILLIAVDQATLLTTRGRVAGTFKIDRRPTSSKPPKRISTGARDHPDES